MRAAILTVSSSVAAGRADDLSGALLARLAAEQAGAEVAAQDVVADDRAAIEAALRGYIAGGVELVLTTGGTGLTPDDVTPEATRAVMERDAPGFAEAMRAEAVRRAPNGVLSRGVSGSAGATLILNFPGSPRAVEELFPVVAPALGHAVRHLRGDHRHRP